ncbi:DUF3592 domain-containing protein [Actinopolymorpha cephalotaxi]|uniref:DUF3592 domain-containing protein n=1 Tax=Actinopolymorpha cephalotaxi TaxID=504797 RepID=A0ABX2S9J5_9ACTN|nr:DUF3592 domain-containing protein [Actinopolymorpha cephalotaxi]NYH86318.1 hypothetical protein [Actinopolymorpha cephalotaxi]
MAAALFAALAIVLGYARYVLATHGQIAEGVVLDRTRAPYWVGKGSDGPRITVRFTTKDGRQVEDWTGDFVDDPPVGKGDPIRVVYDPDDPSMFQDVRWGGDYLGPAVFGGGAVVSAAFALWDLRPDRTARHRSHGRSSRAHADADD